MEDSWLDSAYEDKNGGDVDLPDDYGDSDIWDEDYEEDYF
jgi:hypothetical protein